MYNPYGHYPSYHGLYDIDLNEYMFYMYLPVVMDGNINDIRLPGNLEVCRSMVEKAINDEAPERYNYAYITAKKGFATPDNPLNRPGWHCDGFGTNDMNYIWWKGSGTRFAIQAFHDISNDHCKSMVQFEEQIDPYCVETYGEAKLYGLDPYVVHSTPLIQPPGEMRQFIKISLSDHQYNLEDNSHNYLFNYKWDMIKRSDIRNDPHTNQRDYK